MSRSWWVRLWCYLREHPGVYRQWEWRPIVGQWRERDDAWTCIRCQQDVIAPAPQTPRYRVERPHMEAGLIRAINVASEAHGTDNIRVRGGDPATRQPRS